jgi:hypothetical protein
MMGGMGGMGGGFGGGMMPALGWGAPSTAGTTTTGSTRGMLRMDMWEKENEFHCVMDMPGFL